MQVNTKNASENPNIFLSTRTPALFVPAAEVLPAGLATKVPVPEVIMPDVSVPV